MAGEICSPEFETAALCLKNDENFIKIMPKFDLIWEVGRATLDRQPPASGDHINHCSPDPLVQSDCIVCQCVRPTTYQRYRHSLQELLYIIRNFTSTTITVWLMIITIYAALIQIHYWLEYFIKVVTFPYIFIYPLHSYDYKRVQDRVRSQPQDQEPWQNEVELRDKLV